MWESLKINVMDKFICWLPDYALSRLFFQDNPRSLSSIQLIHHHESKISQKIPNQ